jgi:hypothetical protein
MFSRCPTAAVRKSDGVSPPSQQDAVAGGDGRRLHTVDAGVAAVFTQHAPGGEDGDVDVIDQGDAGGAIDGDVAGQEAGD